jgi:hypothetical protein
MQAVNFITTRAPKISLSFRQKGTELWPQTEKTPGPGKTKKKCFRVISGPRYNKVFF